jgi:HEAT repeat protein
MCDQTPDTLLSLRQLNDSDWKVRATAARTFVRLPDAALPELPRLFELTLDDHAPVREICDVAIGNMKLSAVPFLLEQTCSQDASHRQHAIELLSLIGPCGGEPHEFATQVLGARMSSPPDWGNHTEEVFQAFFRALSDPDFSVRFAAASVLDDCNRLIDKTIPVFVEAFSCGTAFQRNWAALRLGRIGPQATAACEALARVAGRSQDVEDRWDRYTILAAQVALRRIGCTSQQTPS